MLTQRQLDILKFLHAQTSTAGVCPSFEEMSRHVGLVNRGAVHRILTSLEERGFIRRLRNRARAIEVIKLPECISGRRPDDAPVKHDVLASHPDEVLAAGAFVIRPVWPSSAEDDDEWEVVRSTAAAGRANGMRPRVVAACPDKETATAVCDALNNYDNR